jgi:DNA adenine methylase
MTRSIQSIAALPEPASEPTRLPPRRRGGRALSVVPARPEKLPAQPQGRAQPFLKWVGGKGALLAQLQPLLPPGYAKQRYFEPFLGGGAMFFHLGPRRAVLGDMNKELVACYQIVAHDVEAIIRELDRMALLHSQEHFYAAREAWNDGRIRSRVERAATFIYFNRTCFNGLWRVNRAGKYNVPMGNYAKPSICMPERLRAAAAALAGAQIRFSSYANTVEDARAGDVVYFDPPYQPASVTANFTGYNAEAFGETAQGLLAEQYRALDRRGCQLMLSNSDTPLIRELYRDFRIDTVMAPRSVNSRADRRGAVAEVVVRNY